MSTKILGITVWLILSTGSLALAMPACEPQPPPPSDVELFRAVGLHSNSHRAMLYRVTQASREHYLFGTTHLGPPLIHRAPPQVVLALRRSKTLLVEAVNTPESIAQWHKLSRNEDNMALQQGLGEQSFRHYLRLMKGSPVDNDQARSLRPWAAMLAVGSPPNRGMGMDQQLLMQARAAGLQIVGMQRLQDIAAALDDLPLQDQFAMLHDTLCQSDALPNYLRQLARLYQAGSPELLHAFSHWGHDNDPVFQRFDHAMVRDRNRVFLVAILDAFHTDKTFVSVGAEHLHGPHGLIDALQEHGFEVAAVP